MTHNERDPREPGRDPREPGREPGPQPGRDPREPGPQPGRATRETRLLAIRGVDCEERADRLAGEEPMAIRAAGPGEAPIDVSITMRTPGHDEELAAGFLFSEGLIAADGIAGFELGHPGDVAHPDNEVTVRLTAPFDASAIAARHFVASASCGICGKASLDAVALRCPRVAPGPVVGRSTIVALPDRLRAAQRVFESTGGLHAAGLFMPDGGVVRVREDVGRHNALDKLLGASLLAGDLPLAGRVVLLSGRLSFELVQRAGSAGVAVLCAVSAPSDLAIETAQRLGMTVVGFLRGDGFNVYAGRERIDLGT